MPRIERESRRPDARRAEPAAALPRGAAVGDVAALRPRQWSKNLLLFAGIVFAAELGDAERWAEAFAAFVAYCAASSAAYLVNDVRDARPTGAPGQALRPIARGELRPERALVLAGVLAVVARRDRRRARVSGHWLPARVSSRSRRRIRSG